MSKPGQFTENYRSAVQELRLSYSKIRTFGRLFFPGKFKKILNEYNSHQNFVVNGKPIETIEQFKLGKKLFSATQTTGLIFWIQCKIFAFLGHFVANHKNQTWANLHTEVSKASQVNSNQDTNDELILNDDLSPDSDLDQVQKHQDTPLFKTNSETVTDDELKNALINKFGTKNEEEEGDSNAYFETNVQPIFDTMNRNQIRYTCKTLNFLKEKCCVFSIEEEKNIFENLVEHIFTVIDLDLLKSLTELQKFWNKEIGNENDEQPLSISEETVIKLISADTKDKFSDLVKGLKYKMAYYLKYLPADELESSKALNQFSYFSDQIKELDDISKNNNTFKIIMIDSGKIQQCDKNKSNRPADNNIDDEKTEYDDEEEDVGAKLNL